MELSKFGALGLILVSVTACVIAPAPPPGGSYEAPCCYTYNEYPSAYYGYWWGEPYIGIYGDGYRGDGGGRHGGGWGGRRY